MLRYSLVTGHNERSGRKRIQTHRGFDSSSRRLSKPEELSASPTLLRCDSAILRTIRRQTRPYPRSNGASCAERRTKHCRGQQSQRYVEKDRAKADKCGPGQPWKNSASTTKTICASTGWSNGAARPAPSRTHRQTLCQAEEVAEWVRELHGRNGQDGCNGQNRLHWTAR
jgi:hypothetical protein